MLRKAALRQLIHRPMTTLLMILIMGLSLGISLFLSALHEGIHEGLTKATEPFSLLVSSPGSQYQLVLTSVFYRTGPSPTFPMKKWMLSQARKISSVSPCPWPLVIPTEVIALSGRRAASLP